MIKNIIFDIGNVLASFRWKDLFKDLGFAGEKFDRIAAATVLHPTMWNEFDRSLMSDEEIIAKTKADVAESNKGQPSYRKVQNVYVSFNEFEKNSTRKVIRQKVIDTYTKAEAK